jgi:hypothetical protein
MTAIEIETYIEAARIKKLEKKLELLDIIPFSSLDGKQIVSLYTREMKKTILEIKVGLGINETSNDTERIEARKARKSFSGKLHKGKKT